MINIGEEYARLVKRILVAASPLLARSSPLFFLPFVLLAGVKQAKPSRCRAAMRLICEEQLRGQTENSSRSLNDSLSVYTVSRDFTSHVYSVSHLFTRNSFKLFCACSWSLRKIPSSARSSDFYGGVKMDRNLPFSNPTLAISLSRRSEKGRRNMCVSFLKRFRAYRGKRDKPL